jgi:hypothetical protein
MPAAPGSANLARCVPPEVTTRHDLPIRSWEIDPEAGCIFGGVTAAVIAEGRDDGDSRT